MLIKTFKCELEVGVPKISQQIKGGNSTVYKGHLPNGMTLAIKEYKGDKIRIKRMLSREVESIQFLRDFNIQNIPEIIEIQHESGLIIYRWIEGKEPNSNSKSMDELIDFCNSLKEIYSLGNIFKDSIDATFSSDEIHSQILNRIQDLEESFSSDHVKILCSNLKEKLRNYGIINKNITFSNKTFSVSDLGTHNMIRSNHRYYFIDFEFFGLDSVSKMVGDFILHPKNSFNQGDITRFITSISNVFKWDSNELMDILPLLTLKWALIAFARSFKEESHKGIVKIGSSSIDKSLGTQYLKYYDLKGHIGAKKSVKTFCSFQGIIQKL